MSETEGIIGPGGLGMDAKQIRSLRPKLKNLLKQFDDCFSRPETRGHLATYVQGQLSDLPRKNCEPIADAAGMPPRTLQQFLSLLEWDHELMKTKLQQLVVRDHAGPGSVGIIDETACPKKGEKSPGVQRQWCGATGKKDNCVVTVHLSYARNNFHCLLDNELFLPESWSNDRARCRAADIPDEMVHRPKTSIALEIFDRARSNGVTFDWLTFDEGYGKSVGFLAALRERKQQFVAEVPVTFTGWIRPPRVTSRRRSRVGRPRSSARVVAGSRPFLSVRDHLEHSPELRDQPWRRFRVKDGEKGPMVWEVKHVWFYPNGVDNLPMAPLHLIVARSVSEPDKIKFFIADAPRDTPLTALLHVAFSRWRVERCFEDQKTELGFDHFEGRSYIGLMRHQTITALTHLFLSRVQLDWGEKTAGTDRLPDPHGGERLGPILVAQRRGCRATAGTDGANHSRHAIPQSSGAKEPPQTNTAKITKHGHQHQSPAPLRLETNLAL
jgi:SRSO17 transposase